MIVVSNASPLISLAKIGGLNLLRDLFGEVSIAAQVHHEIVGGGVDRPGAAAIQSANWIRVQGGEGREPTPTMATGQPPWFG